MKFLPFDLNAWKIDFVLDYDYSFRSTYGSYHLCDLNQFYFFKAVLGLDGFY